MSEERFDEEIEQKVEQRLHELELVKAAIKEKKLSLERTQDRLKLLDHPFVKRIKDTFKESIFFTVQKAKRQAHTVNEKRRSEALENALKKVSWMLKAEGSTVTEAQLKEMIVNMLTEDNIATQKERGVV